MATIHPTAIVDPGAQIADTAVIGPYCVVGPDVVVGERTVLHNHVTLEPITRIGADNEIFPFSVIGADPQDRKYAGERSICVVGDRNKIREHVTIHRGTENGGGVTRIGSDNLIMVASHIAHDCIIGDDICIANQAMLAGHVHIESRANIGGGVGLHHFTTVGTCAFIGGLARVSKDVPPFMIVEGNPAEVRAVNTIALNRWSFTPADIDALKDAFKRLYRDNGAAMTDKVGELRDDYADVPAIITLCDALSATSGGVHGRALEVMRADDKRTPVGAG